MDNLIRLLLRFLLVPLGYVAASIAGTLVVVIASWRLVDAALGGHLDGPAFAVFGVAVGGSVLLAFVLAFVLLPASIGILIAEALAIRSWIYHVLNGMISAWLGWRLYAGLAERSLPFDQPTIVIAAGIAGGFAYWAVAGFSAGFWKPVFRREPAQDLPATTR